jgi:hypothetical protein
MAKGILLRAADIAVTALKAFSGFVGILLGFPHRREPRDLTPRQATAKATIDAALDGGALVDVDVWLPRRGGSTHLAHVVHSERGGVVVTRSRREAARFSDDHMRMFGRRAVVGGATEPWMSRGGRGPVIIDGCDWIDAAGVQNVVRLRQLQHGHARLKRLPDGGVEVVRLGECVCGKERRGPDGGVCGRCGDAIPSCCGF